MADQAVQHFHNTPGHKQIEIGVHEFMCIGALAPFDHPHVFLDMGDDVEKVCPYCSTLYKLNTKLSADETVPAGAIVDILPADAA